MRAPESRGGEAAPPSHSRPEALRGRIAAVDDDEETLAYLRGLLSSLGHEVFAFETPGRFLDSLAGAPPELVLLDLELPGLSGWDVLKALQANPRFSGIPVILLTGRFKRSEDVVRGLQSGACDFLTKPPNADFLAVRIEGLLRRARARGGIQREPSSVRIGALEIDPGAHLAMLGKEKLKLTRLEFELLSCFAANPDKVLTRGFLLQEVWKGSAETTPRTVDTHVGWLRKKLGAMGRQIDTVVGVGYVFLATAPKDDR